MVFMRAEKYTSDLKTLSLLALREEGPLSHKRMSGFLPPAKHDCFPDHRLFLSVETDQQPFAENKVTFS
jgi:hypothetical protein